MAKLPLPRETILNLAAKAVNGPRQDDYGSPRENFERVARMFNCYKGAAFDKLTAEDVAVLNIIQKLSRLSETPGHKDSWVDVAGYASLGYEVAITSDADKEESDDSANS